MFLQEYISAWKQVFTFFFNTKKHEYAMNFTYVIIGETEG